MTEVSLSARATWAGAEFALTVDMVSDEEAAFLSDRDVGARVIESLRARGYHVVDNRRDYYAALTAMSEAEGEPEPTPSAQPPSASTPPAPPAIPILSL